MALPPVNMDAVFRLAVPGDAYRGLVVTAPLLRAAYGAFHHRNRAWRLPSTRTLNRIIEAWNPPATIHGSTAAIKAAIDRAMGPMVAVAVSGGGVDKHPGGYFLRSPIYSYTPAFQYTPAAASVSNGTAMPVEVVVGGGAKARAATAVLHWGMYLTNWSHGALVQFSDATSDPVVTIATSRDMRDMQQGLAEDCSRMADALVRYAIPRVG